MKKFKNLRLLWNIIKRTKADRFVYVFLCNFVIAAFIVMLVEPDIHTYLEGLWYIFVSSSTIGFGDYAAVTLIGRLVTIYMALNEMLLIAIVPGVVVSYYMEVIQRREKETLTLFLDKLEHLPELSKEELIEISNRIKKIK